MNTQLKNLVENSRDTFIKIHEGKKLSKDELKKVVNFFQEVSYQVGLRQL